ncbi:hypothetical protein BWQ96_03695 [Gracilariopsis chorda]|uniref:Uncharacterized protein n=1 Tax=Gracilariopsis chorda TaxID=448386 RepID=A0A2V3IY09_9FLOR|nr:hypothetical protein BWQ96_03695 [Gracilariopsis chorda]|eukprot:PXF46567.1 hypothetical protein BWQ96_03695 [Gracilariopsis chorda]
MPRVSLQCTSEDLAKFANYLAWNFIEGRDLLDLSVEEIIDLYATVVTARPGALIKPYFRQTRLRQVIDFYQKFGAQIGITTLYGFVEAYYKANIFQFPLSMLMVIQAKMKHIEFFEGMKPPSLRLDCFWSKYVKDPKISVHEGDISQVTRFEDRQLCRFMNRPVFEIAMVRRWVLDTNEAFQLPFDAFRMLTFASHWFDTREEIILHFEGMPSLERNRQACLDYLTTCTSDCLDTEMLKEKIATVRFADAFPEMLTHALLRASSSLTGKQLASYVALWGLDLAGDARRINSEACRAFVQRVHEKSPAWARLVELKIHAMLHYSPRIRLVDENGIPWKHSYTVSMLDEYIRLLNIWHNPFSFSHAFCK